MGQRGVRRPHHLLDIRHTQDAYWDMPLVCCFLTADIRLSVCGVRWCRLTIDAPGISSFVDSESRTVRRGSMCVAQMRCNVRIHGSGGPDGHLGGYKRRDEQMKTAPCTSLSPSASARTVMGDARVSRWRRPCHLRHHALGRAMYLRE